ncbi:DUF547 domain-containing protein [Maricaulis sp.]|jgi:uncharacterized protein DUF547|uniref:DUF547 domain-containing protein n=1 Tax=Maricaulis sp. TaxID=1486257 RepID=UPI0025DEB0F0|nr:DUF547 domain-containing protein [Maricaulis sp.]MDF1768165.1 DUF547 domain-containing protein [Maricaulis sp.]
MRRYFLAGIALIAIASTPASHAQSQPMADFSVFAEANDNSNMVIDHEGWSVILRGIVLNVPPMDREPERTRPIQTGTRINTANTTRYRHEGNRVVYHVLNDEYREAITFQREDLEALPDQIGGLSRLSSNEQLAYWFNLYNVAIIEQTMLNYPVRWINNMEAHGSDENVFDAKILEVEGQRLSLNDIRHNIVYANWDDPRVIYGFFNGSVGSPELRRSAYTGAGVWGQLDRTAGEFVNALRGVEVNERELRVSVVYDEARVLFPDFETDLRAHLARYANEETAEQLHADRPVSARVSDWQVADMINGSRRCTGVAGPSTMTSFAFGNAEQTQQTGVVANCATMPTNAAILMTAVQNRRIELFREGRYGEVYTVDLPTIDTTEPAADAAPETDDDSGTE